MSKTYMPLWREAHFENKIELKKNPQYLISYISGDAWFILRRTAAPTFGL